MMCVNQASIPQCKLYHTIGVFYMTMPNGLSRISQSMEVIFNRRVSVDVVHALRRHIYHLEEY